MEELNGIMGSSFQLLCDGLRVPSHAYIIFILVPWPILPTVLLYAKGQNPNLDVQRSHLVKAAPSSSSQKLTRAFWTPYIIYTKRSTWFYFVHRIEAHLCSTYPALAVAPTDRGPRLLGLKGLMQFHVSVSVPFLDSDQERRTNF